MAHFRQRWIKKQVLAALRWSPAVGIFGLRQTGKTTLVQAITKELVGDFESFDRELTLQASRDAPLGFLGRNRLLCIDEAQKGPWIFPAIKEKIGTRRKPSQFLLTGSVRFTLHKEITEALTGRILLFELLPFSIAEANHWPCSIFLSQVLSRARHPSKFNVDFFKPLMHRCVKIDETRLIMHLQRGGLPIPCFTRTGQVRSQWFEGYYETLLTRDISLVDRTLRNVPLRQSLALVHLLAQFQGREITYQDLASGVSLRSTQCKRLMMALETLGLFERIAPLMIGQKPSHRLKIEWKDAGLWFFAAQTTAALTDQVTRMHISQEFRSQISQMTQKPHWFFYRSRDGAEIPWVFQVNNVSVALMFCSIETPRPFDYRSLTSFVKREKNSMGIILGNPISGVVPLADRIWLLPYTIVF